MARAWVYGDNINTDALVPGHALALSMAEMASHCLESLDPAFAGGVKPGDVFVAGQNMGLGSAREVAPLALKQLGISVVLAKSFARIFYRNAFNVGLPVLFFPQADEITMGDELTVDIFGGALRNETRDKTYALKSLPPHLAAIIHDGGLIPHLKVRLSGNK